MASLKRCIISKDGEFRVSNPGKDVASENQFDFMLHEDMLASQPYHFSYVECPFSTYTGNGVKDQSVNVTVPDVDSDPVVILFPVTSASVNSFPLTRDRGSGSDSSGYNVDKWFIVAKVVSSTQITVRFIKPSDGRKSPKGCYLVLARNL